MCLSVLVFATAYQGLAQHPGELDGIATRLDSLYFTMVTLATVGYGDITLAGSPRAWSRSCRSSTASSSSRRRPPP